MAQARGLRALQRMRPDRAEVSPRRRPASTMITPGILYVTAARLARMEEAQTRSVAAGHAAFGRQDHLPFRLAKATPQRMSAKPMT
jgi:hypothetical protein